MAIELPLDGGSRILYRPQAGGTIQDIRHFWDHDAALGGLVRWVIGHVVEGVFYGWPEDIVTARFPSDILFDQQSAGSKGQYYVGKIPRINELLKRYGDVTPDVPNTPDFDLMNENKVISGYFRMRPHGTDTHPVYEVYYRPDPQAPPPREIWDYT